MTDERKETPEPIPSELAQSDESFVELVEEFVNGLGERVDEMAQAARGLEFNRVQTLAHQLKGSAGAYGYSVITERAAELELNAIAEEIEAVQTSLTDLESLVARVVIRV